MFDSLVWSQFTDIAVKSLWWIVPLIFCTVGCALSENDRFVEWLERKLA